MAEEETSPRWWKRPQIQAFVLGVATSIVATELLSGMSYLIQQVQGVAIWVVIAITVLGIGAAIAAGVPTSRAILRRAWVRGLGTTTAIFVVVALIGFAVYGLAQLGQSQDRSEFLWAVRHGIEDSSFTASSDSRYLAEGERVCADVSRGMTKLQYDVAGTDEVSEPATVRDAVYQSALRHLCMDATAEPVPSD